MLAETNNVGLAFVFLASLVAMIHKTSSPGLGPETVFGDVIFASVIF
jgi:hypothetical protein